LEKRKNGFNKAVLLCLGASTLWLFCSNPTKQTLRWRSNIELPVSNTSFKLGQKFQDLFNGMKDLQNFSMLGIDSLTVDSTSDPKNHHCVAFSKTNRDTFSFQQKQDSIGNKTFDVVLGLLPLSGAGNKTIRIALGAPTPLIPATIKQTATGVLTLPKIRRLVADSDPANGKLGVRVTNTTAATIDSLTISLTSLLPSGASTLVGRLGAGLSADAVINIAGKTVDSAVSVQLSGILFAGGSIAAGSGLDLSFSFGNLKVRSAIVMDSMVAISDTFVNNYKITDSVNIDYTDIDNGFFNYILDNKTGLDLYVSANHHDLWMTPACIQRHVVTYQDLHLFADSADSFNFYSGTLIEGDRHVEPRQAKRFAHLNISKNRMFPKWVDSLKNSVTRVDYIIRTQPSGKWDTINSTDGLIFTIQPVISYKQMSGTLVKDFNKSTDTQSVEIPFPWPKEDRDSLRNHFVLQRVMAAMNLATTLPDSAYLGNLLVGFRVVAPAFPDSVVDTTILFSSIKNDTAFKRTLNITRVVNNFPDSVKIITRVKVPAGTRIRAINDLDITENNVGSMTVRSIIDYKLNAYFDWSIPKPTTMDLGADTFTIEEKSVRAFRRMDDRSFTFGLTAENHSNVNIKLFALFAPDSLRTKLYVDSLSTNRVNALIADTTGAAEADGYVNLLGPKGVTIPARNGIANDSINLSNEQMARILATNNGSMRWLLRFVPANRDSMANDDYVKINSWIHLEGINNMDSISTAFE
jgi:hypothetical protein